MIDYKNKIIFTIYHKLWEINILIGIIRFFFFLTFSFI